MNKIGNMKLISISLATALLLGSTPVKAHAEDGTNYNGVPFTVENGILTLGEEGATYTLNTTYEDAPWNMDETITEVRILGEILVTTTDGMFYQPEHDRYRSGRNRSHSHKFGTDR